MTVHNEITEPEEGTTIHWHGLLQKGTPWMDGVPSLTQCPIAPGSTFTCVCLFKITAVVADSSPSYKFVADTYGTSWYHSHYEAQLIDGVFGPLVVYGPTHVHFDYDLGPIVLQDCKTMHTPFWFVQTTDEYRFPHAV